MRKFLNQLFGRVQIQKICIPINLEILESRCLLSASYQQSDLDGIWAIISNTQAGNIRQEAGSIVGADTAVTNVGSSIANNELSLSLSSVDGKVAFAAGSDSSIFDLRGTISSNKSIVNLTDDSGWTQTILVRQNNNYAGKDLAGTWAIVSESLRGNLTFAMKGNLLVLTGASIKNSTGAAVAVSATNSTVNMTDFASNGTFSIILNDRKNVTIAVLSGVLADAKDVVVFTTTGTNQNDVDVGTATKTTALGVKFAAADQAGTWYIFGDTGFTGSITVIKSVTGKYTISGNNDAKLYGNIVNSISGSLSIDSTGKIRPSQITIISGQVTKIYTVTGQMNASKNLIALSATGMAGCLILTTSADHATININSGKTLVVGQLTKNETSTINFKQLLSIVGISDIDDVGNRSDIKKMEIQVLSGTLAIDNTVIAIEDGWVTLDCDKSINWKMPSNAKIAVNNIAFKIRLVGATDIDATSLAYKRLSNKIGIVASADVVREPAIQDDTKSITVKLTRQVVEGALTIGYALSGSAEWNNDYTVIDINENELFGNITFADGKNSTVLKIIPKVATLATGDRNVILTLVAPNESVDTYELAAKKSISAIIKGNHRTGSNPITVTSRACYANWSKLRQLSGA